MISREIPKLVNACIKILTWSVLHFLRSCNLTHPTPPTINSINRYLVTMITTDTMGIIICCISTIRSQENIVQAWTLRQSGIEWFGFVLSILRLKSTHFDEAALGTRIATRCCTCWKHKHDATMVQIYMCDRDRFAMTKIHLWPDWRSKITWKYKWGIGLWSHKPSVTYIPEHV